MVVSSVSQQFSTHLANLLKARFPFLYIATWEEDRAFEAISAVAGDASLIRTPRKVYQWSITTGLTSAGGRADCATGSCATESALKALDFIQACDEPAVFVMRDVHPYFGSRGAHSEDPRVIRRIRDLVPHLKRSQRPKNVVFLCPTVVLPLDLQKDVTIVDYALPTYTDVRALLQEMIEANRETGRICIDISESDADRLARTALGLTLQEAENAFALAMVRDGRLDASDIDVVLDEKCQVIKKSQVLEFIRGGATIEDVGGLENLKRWLRKRNRSWLPDAQRYCLPAPKGVLITGVPGCGKSLTAKAISAMWQMPLLRLDIGRVFSGVVGSSEENIRRAIKTAEAIAPCVLWVDEIEKGFSGMGSNGDGGTSSRVFGTFLTWMQEKTQPVFVVATANRIESLPAELLRKGRFDEVFFADLPTLRERRDIFGLHVSRRLLDPVVAGDFAATDAVLDELAAITEGFSGAEIEHCVITALFEAFSEDRAISMADLRRAVSSTVPLSVTQAEQIRALREWANVRAVAATPKEDRVHYAAPEPNTASSDDTPSTADISSWRGGRAIDF